MQTQYLFSSLAFGRWKQEARALKRSTNLLHHQALEQVAKSKRFENWHQVVGEAKLNRTTETAYRSGLLVAYDVKNAMDDWVPDDSFVDNWRALHFCEKDILAWYRRGDDEAEGEEKHAIPSDPDKYLEEFENWLTNVCLFRYCGPTVPATPRAVLPILDERCFFSPMFFWHEGQFVDPWRDLAIDGRLDMTGNTDLNISDL
ncbi:MULTISPECIES: hypothetical protein [unclassified Janthinobacterium]|uniref:hypothetical protein n=1 Tax=unclassified Janthinobacterium TaxID=2610881 RepID=UPI0012F7817A|nr:MULTISPECIES: hypothetical protein [unclassified Janthinobacterium]MEC5161677.1 hypothetical protein [Janthinobacterium sp. CG_S6]